MRVTGMVLFFLAASMLTAADRPRMNPYAGQPLDIQAGAKLYRRYCAACHDAGEKAPPLASGALRGVPAKELFGVLKDGRLARGMPSWAQLPPEQRWQIVAWLQAAQ